MTLARMANFGFAFARAAVTRAMKFAALFAAREVSTRPDPASRRGNLLKRAADLLHLYDTAAQDSFSTTLAPH